MIPNLTPRRLAPLLAMAAFMLVALAPAHAQDAAQLVVRIDRLEGQMRTLNGQLEQMQFQNRRLEEQLKKFQADMDFRLQSGGTGAAPKPGQSPVRRTDLGEPPVTGTATPLPGAVAAATPRKPPRGDAFDPNQQPAAPGAPRNIGTLTTQEPGGELPVQNARPGQLPGGPISLDDNDDPNSPVDLQGNPRRPQGAAPAVPGAPRANANGTIIAAIPGAGGPKEEFDLAQSYLKQGQYETAEQGFRGFLQKNPRDRLTPDAIYYLGETYFQRNRHREAAEQFLKLSTDYSKAARAPEGLLRLGMSLKALGAKEQACATFGEVARRYPTSAISVRNRADQEQQRAKC